MIVITIIIMKIIIITIIVINIVVINETILSIFVMKSTSKPLWSGKPIIAAQDGRNGEKLATGKATEIKSKDLYSSSKTSTPVWYRSMGPEVT